MGEEGPQGVALHGVRGEEPRPAGNLEEGGGPEAGGEGEPEEAPRKVGRAKGGGGEGEHGGVRDLRKSGAPPGEGGEEAKQAEGRHRYSAEKRGGRSRASVRAGVKGVPEAEEPAHSREAAGDEGGKGRKTGEGSHRRKGQASKSRAAGIEGPKGREMAALEESHCGACGKAFRYARTRELHEAACKGVKPFVCECGMRFKRKGQLSAHKARVHFADGIAGTCSLCGKDFGLAIDLKAHEPECRGERPFKCECGKRFKRRAALEEHKATHDKEAIHACEFCGKHLATARTLRSHERECNEERPYRCECGKRFKRSTALEKHKKRAHSTDSAEAGSSARKPAATSEKSVCRGKKTAETKSEKVHRKISRKERPFECECGKRFARKERLDAHKDATRCAEAKGGPAADPEAEFVDVVGGAEPEADSPMLGGTAANLHGWGARFKCRYCEHRMATKALLKEHERAHLRFRKNACRYCRRTTASRRHEEANHPARRAEV